MEKNKIYYKDSNGLERKFDNKGRLVYEKYSNKYCKKWEYED